MKLQALQSARPVDLSAAAKEWRSRLGAGAWARWRRLGQALGRGLVRWGQELQRTRGPGGPGGWSA